MRSFIGLGCVRCYMGEVLGFFVLYGVDGVLLGLGAEYYCQLLSLHSAPFNLEGKRSSKKVLGDFVYSPITTHGAGAQPRAPA